MERRKFEDLFQEAFKEAEVSPSENVWTNIELDLEKADGGKMKRRLLFFKLLAAASVAFAMSIAGIGYYVINNKVQHSDLVQQTNSEKETTDETLLKKDDSSAEVKKEETRKVENVPAEKSETQTTEKALANNELESAKRNEDARIQKRDGGLTENSGAQATQALANDNQKSSQHANDDSRSKNRKDKNLASLNENTDRAVVGDKNTEATQQTVVSSSEIVPNHASTTFVEKRTKETVEMSRQLPAFYQPQAPALPLPVSKADPGALLLAKLAAEERQYAEADKKREKNKSEKLWTSVGFAAGGFNSINSSVNPTTSNTYALSTSGTSSVAAKQSNASGVAYSVGFSIGTRISDRWILQGGLNYLTQSSDYTANSVLVDNNLQSPQAESLNTYKSTQAELADARTQKVAQTFPYSVNNNVQFVSLPVQTGYLVVNRKFGFQVNAGVSTDLFLQNTITPEGGGIDKTTQGRGDDSPYRSLNFSGLMGTELSYKLGYHYRISLNPGLRYPFSSVYKSDTGVQANPLTFDVGLRFRYIFH